MSPCRRKAYRSLSAVVVVGDLFGLGLAVQKPFVTHLAVDQPVSASTQNQAFSALLFLYREVLERDFGWLDDIVRAMRPKRIPAVFTHVESMAILDRLRGVNWLVCKLLYGSGLRGIEALRLRVKDLESKGVNSRDSQELRDADEFLRQSGAKSIRASVAVWLRSMSRYLNPTTPISAAEPQGLPLTSERTRTRT